MTANRKRKTGKGGEPLRVGNTIRVNAYAVVERAVEEVARWGWHRAFKYTDKPTDDAAAEAISLAVMNALSEVFDFGDRGE